MDLRNTGGDEEDDGEAVHGVQEIEERAKTFLWLDHDEDVAKLREIALKHDPSGRFRILESARELPPGDPRGDFSVRIHPTYGEWLEYLNGKYDPTTALVVGAQWYAEVFGIPRT